MQAITNEITVCNLRGGEEEEEGRGVREKGDGNRGKFILLLLLLGGALLLLLYLQL